MRRLVCLGVLVGTGLLGACSSDSAPCAAGPGAGACLDPSAFSSFFSIADSTFCAVALYTAPEPLRAAMPTWGSHGGPLLIQGTTADTSVTLERWTAPAGATGIMTVAATPVASAKPAGTFLGSQAVDLPFFGWTAISWANAFPNTVGQLEMVAGGAIAATDDVNGPFSVAAVPAASSPGRLFYAGLSPLGMATTVSNGLYQADACSAPSPALGSGPGCAASAAVATWGDSGGPIATDSNGDVIAVMNSVATGNQEARGFLAAAVAPGSGPTDGVTLFTLPGFSGSLAALSPTATGPGLVVFQPFDSATFAPLDVVEQSFTTSSGALAAVGTPTPLLTLSPAQPQTLSFLVDGSQRLWVAVSGASSTTYVVLARP